MEGIRLASQAEVEAIREGSDLTPQCTVLQWPIEKPMTAVLRNCMELDPIYYGENTTNRKAMFAWGLENIMRSMGMQRYYFNISVDDEAYQHVVKTWGAEQVSHGPEFRFRKVL